MVYLSRIYTRSGDQGETSLGSGERVPKDHVRVEAYGTVDELNAVLGALVAQLSAAEPAPSWLPLLRQVQNDLFDLGADLCRRLPVAPVPDTALRVRAEQVQQLEQAIDQLNADLPPLRSFILPGGNLAAAWCHLARTVCRRAERRVVTLSHQEPINPQVLSYLNRLSDLLFVVARVLNRESGSEYLWEPGKGPQPAAAPRRPSG